MPGKESTEVYAFPIFLPILTMLAIPNVTSGYRRLSTMTCDGHLIDIRRTLVFEQVK